MPKFTIDLTPGTLARLQAIVTQHNANQGTTLTVADWLLLHVKELAIGQELATAVDTLRKQAEDNANATLAAAVTAERDRLIASLGGQ